MDQKELQQLVETVSLTSFHLPFEHQAVFNRRLRTTGGRYHLVTHDLDFNPKILDTFGMEEFLGVIKHELCHYHLHLAGKGYQHKDRDFKQLLKQVGGTRFVRSLNEHQSVPRYWLYECTNCHQKLYRQRKFNTGRYVCAACHGRFHLTKDEKIAAKQ